jgi:hypothetical protein
MLNQSCVISRAAEAQRSRAATRDDPLGFAACCEDAALPFRVEALLIWAAPSDSKASQGAAQNQRATAATEGQSRILTTGGEAVAKSC